MDQINVNVNQFDHFNQFVHINKFDQYNQFDQIPFGNFDPSIQFDQLNLFDQSNLTQLVLSLAQLSPSLLSFFSQLDAEERIYRYFVAEN